MDLTRIIESNECLSEERVVVLCKYQGNLVAVPCDNEMSGYYPVYDKAVVIKENVKGPRGAKIEGLLFNKIWYGYDCLFVVDSWDGFQPVDIENPNDVIKFIKWISRYI